MKTVKVYDFKYEKYGSGVVIKAKDWSMIVKFLERNGVSVSERGADGYKRSPNCTCDTRPHASWCPDSKKR